MAPSDLCNLCKRVGERREFYGGSEKKDCRHYYKLVLTFDFGGRSDFFYILVVVGEW